MRKWTALIAALMLAASCAAAEKTDIRIYGAPGCLTKEARLALVQRLEQAMPQASFAFTEDEAGTLWQQILGDSGPQLTICPAQEAKGLAQEGLLLPLDMTQEEAECAAKVVLSACTYEDEMFMAPLYARHRHMAVSRLTMEKLQIAALMDERAFPVWQPMQLYQVLEEAALEGGCAMEIWPCAGEEGDALLALIQALYGGEFVPAAGSVRIDNDAAVMALEWLRDMVEGDLIGVAKSREEALRHFLEGETALFIDWTDAEAKALAASGRNEWKIETRPYPSSLGVSVLAPRVIGLAALKTGDDALDALVREAADFIVRDESTRRILGGRGLSDEEALWLPDVGADGTLRALIGTAVDAAIAGDMEAEAALRLAQAAYDGGRKAAFDR